MGSKLGCIWYPYHKQARDPEIIAAWQPAVIEVDEHRISDPFFIEWLFAALPASTIVFRNVALSNTADRMHADPLKLADEHARYWLSEFERLSSVKGFDPARVVCVGVNEPPVHDAGHIERVVRYTTSYLDKCKALGVRAGALRLSVGWPDNTGQDTRVAWEIFAPVRDAILRYNHALILNEYWSKDGPQKGLGWLADRFGQCPWNVPIIIGECGVDQFVAGAEDNTGWQGVGLSKEDYLAQLAWYDQNVLQRDRRVIGGQIFMYDYGNNEWASFDVKPIREELAVYARAQAGEPVPEPLPYPRYPDNVTDPLDPHEPDPTEGLHATLWTKAKAPGVQLISPNPGAALERAAWLDDFRTALSNEFGLKYDGKHYVAQLFYRRAGEGEGEERVYYVEHGDWGNVEYA